ncbi:MAG: Abi family protein [Ruthenibacterium sp.]
MPTTGEVKPFISYADQIALLKRRGLIVSDDSNAMQILCRLNYYRLSAYSLTLRKNDEFYEGTTFDNIVALYDFDVDFRKFILQYTHLVEISARAYIAYYHAKVHTPMGYLNNQFFVKENKHAQFITKLDSKMEHSSDVFVIHHKIHKNRVYPIWVAVEEMDFGMLSMFYKNMLSKDKDEIAKTNYNIPYRYVETYLQCSSVARNIAAHGGRFYNRINLSPEVKFSRFLTEKNIPNNTPFAYVLAVYALLADVHKTDMTNDLKNLFLKHPFAEPHRLGFPIDWKEIMQQSQLH